MELSISSRFSPDPRRTPTVRFLERLTKHVSIMSPVPDKPVIVVDFAPIFIENREEQNMIVSSTSRETTIQLKSN